MTDNTENRVLEHLRLMRVDLSTIRDDIREIKNHLTSVENTVASVKRDVGDLYTEVVSQNLRHDRMADRIERIERRLELAFRRYRDSDLWQQRVVDSTSWFVMKGIQVTTLGISEAKKRPFELVERAAQGEEIVIARRGEQVACLMPPRVVDSPYQARALAARIRKSRAGHALGGGLSVADLIPEGTR